MLGKVGMGVQPSNHWYQNPAVIASIVTFVALGAILGASAVYGYLQGVGTINFAFLCSGSGVSVLMAFLSPVFTLCQKKKTSDEQLSESTFEGLQQSVADLTQNGKLPTILIGDGQKDKKNVDGRDRTYSDFPCELMQPVNRGPTKQFLFPPSGTRTSPLDGPGGWGHVPLKTRERTYSNVSDVSVLPMTQKKK